MPEVNKGRVGLLVAALRSGEYTQAKGRLHRVIRSEGRPPGWCCLGVACDIASKFGLNLARSIEGGCDEAFDGASAYLPPSVIDWYGFDGQNPYLKLPEGCSTQYGVAVPAADLNDGGYTDAEGEKREAGFSQIADFFEATYLKD